jgi:hypothetical protein
VRGRLADRRAYVKGDTMAATLELLFYLVVLMGVVGCFVYLIAERRRKEVPKGPSRPKEVTKHPARLASTAAVERAEALSGTYRLLDLATILDQLAALEAWGMVLELQFTNLPEVTQMIVNADGVDFATSNNGTMADYLDRFRRAATRAQLEVRALNANVESSYLEVKGTWNEIARTVIQLVGDIYGVGKGEVVQAKVFN